MPTKYRVTFDPASDHRYSYFVQEQVTVLGFPWWVPVTRQMYSREVPVSFRSKEEAIEHVNELLKKEEVSQTPIKVVWESHP